VFRYADSRCGREEFLTNLLTRHGVPYISSRDVILTDRQRRAKPLEEYYLPNDNHPNAYQTGLIAQELKSRFLCGTFGMSRTTSVASLYCQDCLSHRHPDVALSILRHPSLHAHSSHWDPSFWTPRDSRRTPS
jgi:hypothetical protein